MKKEASIRKFMAFAFLPLLLAGCSYNEMTDENITLPDYIGFNSNTTSTRAEVVDLATMKADAAGFAVYAAPDAGNSWYTDYDGKSIDGSNNYVFSGGSWSFVQAVKWPDNTSSYPLNFYAFYPASPVGLKQLDKTAPPKLEATYKVPSAGLQEDLLFAKATAKSKPLTGQLPLIFKHSLSRVNFGIIAGEGTMSYIQSIRVENVEDERTYDFINEVWKPQSPAGDGAKYYYLGTPDGSVISTFTPGFRDEVTVNPIYAPPHNKHLILMPQTSPAWNPQVIKNPSDKKTDGGYVSVMYRMETGIGTNGIGTVREVGFPKASDHPNFAALGIGVEPTSPLFVKAGFPLPSDAGNFTWEIGRSYTYNIGLGTHGSCNGYLLDDHYYDNKGKRTPLPLIGDKQIGDKLQDGVIHVKLEINDWVNGGGGVISVGSIIVTPSDIMLPYAAQSPANKTLEVKCIKGDGTPDPNEQWTLSVASSAASWLRLSLSPSSDFNSASYTVTGTGTQTVYIYATANSTQNLRLSDLYLNNVSVGNIAQEWDSYTNPGLGTTPNATSYVGAFWRKEQQGERLIQIDMGDDVSNYGDWRAAVMWLDGNWNSDDIVLALGDSPNLALDAEAPVNLVTGSNTVVKGTVTASEKIIAFRIGLKTTIPLANYPARYAVVLLFYNNCTKAQKILLRQGEDADYIMRPTDPYSGSALGREYAKKFSPYNLTASNIPGGTDISNHPQVSTKGGMFVDYPTKAGAFFTWAGSASHVRRTYHPVNPGSGDKIYNYPGSSNNGDKYWQTSYDACPEGYYRPTDSNFGSNSVANAIGSQMRQSLFTNNVTGYDNSVSAYNALFGYYADGYFDRNPKEESVTGEPITTVNKNSKEVAYKGHLLYNPATYASVFFPVAGYRNDANGTAYGGELKDAGKIGYYWTTTDSGNGTGAACLYVRYIGTASTLSMNDKSRQLAFNVRCVKD